MLQDHSNVQSHSAKPFHPFYMTPMLWLVAFSCASIAGWLLAKLTPGAWYVDLSVVLTTLFLGWRWGLSTRSAYLNSGPDSVPKHGPVGFSLLTDREQNMVLRYVLNPNVRIDRPLETMKVMTKRDRLYMITRLLGVIGGSMVLAGLSIIMNVVVTGVGQTYPQENSGVNWVQLILLLVAAGGLWLIGEAELSESVMLVIMSIALCVLMISKSSIDAIVLVPLLIVGIGWSAAFWFWLEWKSWFFVCTDSKVYVIRLYPLGWTWLNDRKRSLRLRGISEVHIDNPAWAKWIHSSIGTILLNGPTDENKQFKEISWLPEANEIHAIIDQAIGDTPQSSP